MINEVYKKGLVAVSVIAALGIAFAAGKSAGRDDDIMKIDAAAKAYEEDALKEEDIISEETPVTVDVDGCVVNPGVYTLEPDSRVDDAIRAAGGLSEGADTKSINKAKMLSDGEKIYVFREGEENISAGYSFEETTGLVNINTASKETLMTLNGIGEVYSQRIIDYRSDKKFKSIDEIKNVKGIGDKTFEKIKDSITVD